MEEQKWKLILEEKKARQKKQTLLGIPNQRKQDVSSLAWGP